MKSKNKILIFAVLATIAEFLALFSLKYHINGLDVNFSAGALFYPGNLIDMLISVALVTGLILNIFKKFKEGTPNFGFILFLTFIPLAALIVLYFAFLTNFNYEQVYIFDYSVKVIFMVFMFFFNKGLQIYLVFYVWNIFIGSKKKFILSFYLSFITVFVLILFSFAYTQYFANIDLTPDTGKKYDAAVVLGAAVWSNNEPSPIFEGRIKKAIELYKKDQVKKIQLTGGRAPGELSEAEVAYKYMLERGIRQKDLLIESNTAASTAQIRYIKQELIGSYGYNDILIISDKFHLKRVLEMSRFFDIRVVGIPTRYHMNLGQLFYYSFRDSLALLLFWLFAL